MKQNIFIFLYYKINLVFLAFEYNGIHITEVMDLNIF